MIFLLASCGENNSSQKAAVNTPTETNEDLKPIPETSVEVPVEEPAETPLETPAEALPEEPQDISNDENEEQEDTDPRVGNFVSFGSYEQDNNTGNAVERTRKLNCQFSNYAVLGMDASGSRYFGKTFKDRKLDIPVDRLIWSGVGSLPVSFDCEMYYEYVVSEEEAAANALFLNFKTTDIEEVKVNGNVINDHYFTEYGDFNYSSEDFSFLDVLSVSNHRKWQDVISNHYYSTGTISNTVQCGIVELFSEEGFNFVISFKTRQGYARSFYDFATKDNIGDPWLNYITGLGNSTNETTFRYIHINTTQKYLRINCYITEGYGSMEFFDWQSYILPIMKFNTTVLQEGDIVLIKRHHVNEIPKGTNYLLNAEAVLVFGEGI